MSVNAWHIRGQHSRRRAPVLPTLLIRLVASVLICSQVMSMPVAAGLSYAVPAANSFSLSSRTELEGIVWQTTDVTCGPAAIATLLREYFLEDVTEEQLYHAALHTMLGEAYMHLAWPVITFRGLLGALAYHDYVGYPVETHPEGLRSYFGQHSVPVVLQLQKPTPHFTLLLGIVDGLYVLADPSIGQVVLSQRELLEHWSGYAIFVQPPGGRILESARLKQRLDDVRYRMEHMLRATAWI